MWDIDPRRITTETAAVIGTAADTFVRPKADFDEFGTADHSELGQDAFIAQIEVKAAMARHDMREAMRIAAREFSVPVTYVMDILGDN